MRWKGLWWRRRSPWNIGINNNWGIQHAHYVDNGYSYSCSNQFRCFRYCILAQGWAPAFSEEFSCYYTFSLLDIFCYPNRFFYNFIFSALFQVKLFAGIFFKHFTVLTQDHCIQEKGNTPTEGIWPMAKNYPEFWPIGKNKKTRWDFYRWIDRNGLSSS